MCRRRPRLAPTSLAGTDFWGAPSMHAHSEDSMTDVVEQEVRRPTACSRCCGGILASM